MEKTYLIGALIAVSLVVTACVSNVTPASPPPVLTEEQSVSRMGDSYLCHQNASAPSDITKNELKSRDLDCDKYLGIDKSLKKPVVSRAKIKEAVDINFMLTLKDPDSVKNLHIGSLTKISCRTGAHMPPVQRWAVPVSYNAKNSYGGYVGQRADYLYFIGNKPKIFVGEYSICPDA